MHLYGPDRQKVALVCGRCSRDMRLREYPSAALPVQDDARNTSALPANLSANPGAAAGDAEFLALSAFGFSRPMLSALNHRTRRNDVTDDDRPSSGRWSLPMSAVPGSARCSRSSNAAWVAGLGIGGRLYRDAPSQCRDERRCRTRPMHDERALAQIMRRVWSGTCVPTGACQEPPAVALASARAPDGDERDALDRECGAGHSAGGRHRRRPNR